ncbi:GntR family transcriptional regulator [Paenibacillus sp. TC-CSREp1]|uniref:GntR family transcriptional regulator n=1 Tax=unclassified Paenibacillus TaxID=185978 RepID=UPI003CF150ED
MKFSNDHPIYLQIKKEFYRRICAGILKPGEKLTSVRETAIEIGVNANTVQRSYSDMERDGIIEKRRGQGSYVTENQQVIQQLRDQIAQEQVFLFYNNMRQIGFSNEEISNKLLETVKKEGKT